MKKPVEFLLKQSERARVSFSAIIKIVLLASIIYSIYYNLWRILFINILLLILILIPYFASKKFELNIPVEFEYILFIFIIISFFLGPLRGLVIQLFFGLAVAFVGFTIMLIIYHNSKIKVNYSLVIVFSFCLSIALGLFSELIKYYLKIYLKYPIGVSDYTYAMNSLSIVAIGAIIASGLSYLYMKGYRTNLTRFFVNRFKKKNPRFFVKRTDSPEELIELIKNGEDDTTEFKSSLRINTHTGEQDKRLEHSVLKSIVAMLNSKGGTLLIGVDDNKTITGIEKDKFESIDKFNLHFSTLLKNHIGNEYLPFLNFEQVIVEDKSIFKVECNRSKKPVFLKMNGTEEFYVRNGPASVLLKGSKLIEYTNEEFNGN